MTRKLPNINQYATAIAVAIRIDQQLDPKFKACQSWEDLHSICDANDYLDFADRKFGVHMLDMGETWVAFQAEAQELVAFMLWGERS